jgi:hypothetical protein
MTIVISSYYLGFFDVLSRPNVIANPFAPKVRPSSKRCLLMATNSFGVSRDRLRPNFLTRVALLPDQH